MGRAVACSSALVLVALLSAPAAAVDMSGRWFVRYFVGGNFGPLDEHWDVTQSGTDRRQWC